MPRVNHNNSHRQSPHPSPQVAILVLFARWVGPSDVYYSLTHFYHSWLVGHIKPRWEAMVGALEKAKED